MHSDGDIERVSRAAGDAPAMGVLALVDLVDTGLDGLDPGD